MSADLLRRAATRLRESALAASHGPWEVGPTFGARDNRVYVRPEDGFDWVGSTRLGEPETVMSCQVSNVPQFRENAAYIALVHPPVALALADWLDEAAAQFEHSERIAERIDASPVRSKRPSDWPASQFVRPLAVARAVLREPEGGDRT